MIIYPYQSEDCEIIFPSVWETARSYHASGLNVIPLSIDGTRTPRIEWKVYQRLTSWCYVNRWFNASDPSGIAVVCGSISGNLEVLDFDCFDSFATWSADFGEMLELLPVIATPSNGRHLYYRCDTIEGSLKLAWNEQGNEILIETKGEAGFVVAPGSPESVHPSGRPYKLLSGDLLNVPTIADWQRDEMLSAARKLNRRVCEPTPSKPIGKRWRTEMAEMFPDTFAQRPGDKFNTTADWRTILEPHGWSIASMQGNVISWTRPGKDRIQD